MAADCAVRSVRQEDKNEVPVGGDSVRSLEAKPAADTEGDGAGDVVPFTCDCDQCRTDGPPPSLAFTFCKESGDGDCPEGLACELV